MIRFNAVLKYQTVSLWLNQKFMNRTLFFFFTLLVFQVNAQDQLITKIAVLGCHNQGQPAPAITYFADSLKPDYSIWIGDNVYADTETDPQHIQRQLEVLENKDGFKKLRETSKFMVTWDDHDFGLNDAGKSYIFKEESKQIHRKFWQLENEIPTGQDGVYYSKLEKQPNGKVIHFIMLDGRFNRDDPGPDADALGENQWKFLWSELKQPADLRFILCGYQVLLNKPTRWEAWIKLGKSRDQMFDLIKSTKAENVIFITGDQHYVEVLHSPANVDYKTFEIMAAGINKNEVPGIATNRSMKADKTIHSAPMIEIHWTQDPYIHFKNYDVIGDRVNSEFKFKLSKVGWK
jgi:alkaline phosphatase D